jgi:acetolactate synthase-1/2/3 large subunit
MWFGPLSIFSAARCCRSTTRCSKTTRSSTSWCAMSRARPCGRRLCALDRQVGVLLVTSGPGATNAVTGLTDALMDSIPMVVCITGQVPTHLIGTDAFQEADTVGITRPCTKHNIPRRTSTTSRASCTRPSTSRRPAARGRSSSTFPKDVQFARGPMSGPRKASGIAPTSRAQADLDEDRAGVELMAAAKKPIFYTGGGVINSGKRPRSCCASSCADRLSDHLDADGPRRLSGLGPAVAGHARHARHLRSQLAMHDCDVMICIGARFDDRVTGRLMPSRRTRRRSTSTSTRPRSTRTCASDVGIVADCGRCWKRMIRSGAREVASRRPLL